MSFLLLLVYHSPLIGPEYQAEVGPFEPSAIVRDPAIALVQQKPTTLNKFQYNQPTTTNDDEATSSLSHTTSFSSSSSSPSMITVNSYFAETVEWNPHLKNFHSDRRKQDALDKYLANVEALFYKDGRHVTQDVALQFLHKCDYDIPMANRLLKPWQPPADPDCDLDEEEMYPADSFCSVCRDGGNLMLCDVCDKSYHAACVRLESVPSGTWTCPYHQCATCFEVVDRDLPSLSCSMCPTSYCSKHIPPDVRVRSDAIGCEEMMCGECLKKEEEYEFIQRARARKSNGMPTQNSCRKAFMHRLQMVLKREGSQLIRMPVVGGRELDLYTLYNQVCKSGGIYAILDQVGWKGVRRALKLPPTVHHQSALLKKFYIAILYSYEKQFFPFFAQLPLKKALAKTDDVEEEEELMALALASASATAPTSSSQSKKKKSSAAGTSAQSQAQSSLDDNPAPLARNPDGTLMKDDTEPENVLVSLKVGMGHVSMGKSKVETAAQKNKKKQKEKERKAKEKEKARELAAASKGERGSKRQRDKKASAKAARGAKRVKGSSDVPMSASAAVASLGLTGPLKEHPSINIWTPTWWAQQSNSSGNVAKHVGVELQGASQLINEPSDIQNAARATIEALAAATRMGTEPMETDGVIGTTTTVIAEQTVVDQEGETINNTTVTITKQESHIHINGASEISSATVTSSTVNASLLPPPSSLPSSSSSTLSPTFSNPLPYSPAVPSTPLTSSVASTNDGFSSEHKYDDLLSGSNDHPPSASGASQSLVKTAAGAASSYREAEEDENTTLTSKGAIPTISTPTQSPLTAPTTSPTLATPKRGRGRPPKSASVASAAALALAAAASTATPIQPPSAGLNGAQANGQDDAAITESEHKRRKTNHTNTQ